VSDHATTIDALRRGAAPEALAAAREAVAAQPDDATALRLLAAALRLSGEREAALEAIDRAIDLAPDDANLHLERAGLMLDGRKLDEAQASLARSVGLDPNQFPAYIIQGQLALGRGDLDEAERLARTAARIAPEHPQVAALEGSIALRRGNADLGLAILSKAAQRWPDEAQLRHALGFAYLAKGHLAFAEQTFRGLLERKPDNRGLRVLLADLLRRQGRPADAADMLAPLVEGDAAPPAVRRLVGEIELQAGRNERALELLRDAMSRQPRDRRAIAGAVEAWRRLDRMDEARAALDAALATHPEVDDLWRARLAFEPFAQDSARKVAQRWLAESPDSVAAMETMSTIHDSAGEGDEAEALALRIVERQPGHARAELRLIDGLLQRGDNDAAVARVKALHGQAPDDAARRNVDALLARTLDRAGRRADAVSTWSRLHAEAVDRRLPLPPVTEAPEGRGWPEQAEAQEGAPGVLLVWGAPGSMIERVAMTLESTGLPVSVDRYRPNPPDDDLQRYDSAQRLRDGDLNASEFGRRWRAALPGRRPGIPATAPVVDWLLTWDNALLHGLRPALPEARLLVAVRDPRDMFLDWLAHGAPVQFGMPDVLTGAQWLARTLEHVAELHEHDLLPHRLLKLDDVADEPEALAKVLADALGLHIRTVPKASIPPRFAAGHWRAYAEPLAEAFAVLTPVARRLGYPEA